MRQAPASDGRGRKHGGATLHHSFGSRSRRANRNASSPMSSTRTASPAPGKANGPYMRFGGLPVLRPVSSRTQSWRRHLRRFGGSAKVDRIDGHAAKFSKLISIA